MSERNELGTWKKIGYVAPGAARAGSPGTTSNFTYVPGDDPANNGSLSTSGSFDEQWGAINTVALNDCSAQTASTAEDANWTITVNNTSTGNSVAYVAGISNDDCEQLTPSFRLIGSATTSSNP